LGDRLRGGEGARKGPLPLRLVLADLLVRALSCHAESVSDVLPGHSHILRRLAGVAFDRIQARCSSMTASSAETGKHVVLESPD
jgi:hypothetical protein